MCGARGGRVGGSDGRGLEMSAHRNRRSGDPAQSGRAAVLADLALIAIAAVVLMLPSLSDGVPVGHDTPYHTVYMEGVSAQVAAGEAYPRWLAGLWDGAGGPDLYFYAPLSYWLGGLIRLTLCPGCGGSELLLAVGLGAQICYGAGLRALGRRWFGRWPALAGAVVGMALPFHLGTEWGDRFAFGEFAVAAMLPWHLAAVLDCLAGRAAGLRLAILTALVLLGHIVTAVMLAAVYPFLLLALGRAADWRAIARLAAGGALGLGLAAVYWYPAVTLLDSVNGDFIARQFFDPTVWLFWPASLMLADPMIFGLWPSFFSQSAAALLLLYLARSGSPEAQRLIAALVVFTMVMQTPLAWPLFEYTPLKRIQFPWRLLVLSDIAFAAVVALAAHALAQGGVAAARRIALVGAVGMVALAAAAEHPGLRDSRNIYRGAAPGLLDVTAGYLSWLPVEAEQTVRGDLQSSGITAVRLIAGTPPVWTEPALPAARLALVSAAPRRQVYEIDLPEPATVVFRRTFWRFATLRAELEGVEFPMRPTSGFPLSAADLPAGPGRYVLELPAVPQERRGMLVSLVSLGVAIGWLVLARRRRHGIRAG